MKRKLQLGGLLLTATISFTLSGLQYNVPLAAWLYLILTLFIFRSYRSYKVLLVLFLLSWMAGIIKVWGLLADELLANIALSLVLCLLSFIPFLLDRWLSPAFKGITASLVFPCALVTVEFLLSFSPFGAITSLAATQINQLELIQIASVTGMFGVSFIMAWAASCAVILLRQEGEAKERRTLLMALLTPSLLLCCYGGLRLHLQASESDTIRIAMPKTLGRDSAKQDFELSLQAALGGNPDIIQFHEAAFVCDECHPQDLLQAAQAAAKKHHLIIMLPLITPDEEGIKSHNKVLIIDEKGELAAAYNKHNVVPFVESSRYSGASVQPSILDTPLGRMATVICFDLDYPSFMREAGKRRADFIMAPSFDWDPLTSFHSASLKYRAIENGASLVRNTHTGISVAYDYLGQQLLYTNHYRCNEERYVLFADIPSQGTGTLYSLLGDSFSYACVAGLCFFLMARWRQSANRGDCAG